MPIYEYCCTDCNHEWETQASIKSDPEKVCPKCEKETAKRLISGGQGFQLIGSGWFRDGY